MRLVWGHTADVAAFVSKLIWGDGRGFSSEHQAAGIINRDGYIVGGVVFHNWNPWAGTIELSAAATTAKWLTRRIITQILAYPFIKCGCQMIMGQTEKNNRRDRRLMCGIGFSEQHIERLFGRDNDGILQTLTDDEWKAGVYYDEGIEDGTV